MVRVDDRDDHQRADGDDRPPEDALPADGVVAALVDRVVLVEQPRDGAIGQERPRRERAADPRPRPTDRRRRRRPRRSGCRTPRQHARPDPAIRFMLGSGSSDQLGTRARSRTSPSDIEPRVVLPAVRFAPGAAVEYDFASRDPHPDRDQRAFCTTGASVHWWPPCRTTRRVVGIRGRHLKPFRDFLPTGARRPDTAARRGEQVEADVQEDRPREIARAQRHHARNGAHGRRAPARRPRCRASGSSNGWARANASAEIATAATGVIRRRRARSSRPRNRSSSHTGAIRPATSAISASFTPRALWSSCTTSWCWLREVDERVHQEHERDLERDADAITHASRSRTVKPKSARSVPRPLRRLTSTQIATHPPNWPRKLRPAVSAPRAGGVVVGDREPDRREHQAGEDPAEVHPEEVAEAPGGRSLHRNAPFRRQRAIHRPRLPTTPTPLTDTGLVETGGRLANGRTSRPKRPRNGRTWSTGLPRSMDPHHTDWERT